MALTTDMRTAFLPSPDAASRTGVTFSHEGRSVAAARPEAPSTGEVA